MNKDFRITTDALDHPKLIKLERMCGEHGVLCLFRLWAFTARYHPKGILNAMTAEDIEIAVRWKGEPGDFIGALFTTHLIDDLNENYQSNAVYAIHDWKEHNGFAYHAPERSKQARINVEKRWNKESDTDGNMNGITDSNTPSPSPSPNPNPKDMPPKPGGKKKGNPVPIEDRVMNTPAGRIVQQWHRKYLKRTGIHWTGDIKRMGGQTARLFKAHTEDDLLCAMTWLLDQEATQYVVHEFDHFVKKASTYIIKAKKAGYFT